jgi:hypothetical protein
VARASRPWSFAKYNTGETPVPQSKEPFAKVSFTPGFNRWQGFYEEFFPSPTTRLKPGVNEKTFASGSKD